MVGRRHRATICIHICIHICIQICICIGIELLADLRALDESDLEIFGFDADTAAALWLELEQLPQVYIIYRAAAAGRRDALEPQPETPTLNPNPKP